MEYRLFLGITLFLMLSSCDSTDEKHTWFQQQMEQAERLGYQHPDSALAIYNLLLTISLHDEEIGLRPSILLEKAMLMDYLGEADSAVILLNLVVREALLTGDSTHVAAATLQLGHHYLDRGYNSLAQKYYEKVAAGKSNTPQTKARALTGLATASANSGEYPAAIEKYNRAMDIFSESNDTVNVAVQLQNLAVVHAEKGNYELALSFNERAIAAFLQSGDSVRLADSYINKAIYNKNLEKDSVNYYYDLALDIYKHQHDSARINLITYNKAVYLIRKQPQEAAGLLNRVFDFSQRRGINQGVVMALNALSDLHSTTDPPKALLYAQQAANRAAQAGLKSLELKVLKTISNRLTEQNQFEPAVEQLLKMNHLRDSLNRDQRLINAAELQQYYLISELEQQNLALKNETMLQRQKSTTALKFGIAISLLALFLIILLAILFHYYKNSQIAYNALFEIYRNRQSKKPGILAQTFDNEVEVTELSAIKHKNDPRFQQIADNLNRLIAEEEIFRNRYLSAVDLAARLGISRRVLSAWLQQEHGQNFAAFINRHRINYACKLIESTPENQLKLDYIAIESGFNNRQTFYKTFHQITGVTPGKYHRELANKN